MGRKKDPNAKYRMKAFRSNGHRYAITTDPKINRKGVRVPDITVWGKLDEPFLFIPNIRFRLLSSDEKERFLFPEAWDLSRRYDRTGVPDDGSPYEGEDRYLLYGDSFMLDLLARGCGLKEDLETVFGRGRTAEILTIAYFRLIYGRSCSRLESSSKTQWYPSAGIDSSRITRLSQSVTKEQADRFMALRTSREGGAADWFGIDSTSISSHARDLADSRWGKNKEHDLARQVGLLVMYDMATGLPAHYRKLPGNIPDSRTLRLLLEELKSAGFSDYGLILDRAYLSKENLDLLVPEGIRAIFMAKTGDAKITKCIGEALSESGSITARGVFLRDHDCYAKDYEYPYCYRENEGKGHGTSVPQRLCLFFDPEARGAEDKALTVELLDEEESLLGHLKGGGAPDERLLKKFRRHFAVETDGDGTVVSCSRDEEKIAGCRKRCGFFAIVCTNMDAREYPPDWVLSKYRMRDSQEKAFMYLKGWQGGRRLRTWTEPSTDGRVFFQFVALILNCYLHARYFSTSDGFRKRFATPWDVLDEMRSVRLVQLRGRSPKVSEFVGKQVDIFDEFGLEIPKGSRPGSRKKPKTGGKKKA
ncbi:MAG: transposase [Spirochaetia bacterium]|jgi:hypothetical protein|nr:transposase [Spirochaetia bacterium]